MGQALGSIQEPGGVFIVSSMERPLAGKRGLVVDDEFFIVLDLQEFLEESGAKIVCQNSAASAREALASQGPFDFAVIDLHIGGSIESGFSVADALSERGIPFVFLSGLRSDDARVGRFKVPLVEKPYRPEALVATIGRLLGGV
jgi:CheY-like chemotaxis protein